MAKLKDTLCPKCGSKLADGEGYLDFTRSEIADILQTATLNDNGKIELDREGGDRSKPATINNGWLECPECDHINQFRSK